MDTLSNMLSTIKNAYLVRKEAVEVPYSKQSEAVAKVLEASGFVKKVKSFKHKGKAYKGLSIELSYDETDLPKLMNVRRISKPGRRIYKKADEIRSVKGGYGVLVVSTPRGIMSGDEARKRRLGGELICEVW
ncbi:30S ribosomal protein S8 [candidate division WWE3 bacterium]|nr:30S ribosomal protein S8 [candidate division WWE3 bacterium]